MKIKHYLITGDTHGKNLARLEKIRSLSPEYQPEETAVIILGDSGFNFWLNKTDKKAKALVNETGYTVYCVRGNHEERAENIETYVVGFDENVGNFVFFEEEFPNIRFLIDGECYNFNGKQALVLGGAYSVDKYYRLNRAAAAGQSFTGWFESEQLTEEEMERIEVLSIDKEYDFVLSHAAPLEWEPTDLFLSFIDQSTVDKRTEKFLSRIKQIIKYNIWCFGHYHADRIERPHVEQYYNDYENLETVWQRWQNYDATGELDWWLEKSPNFYMEVSHESN